MTGKQIKLFLVDGTPGGLTTAEITNWTGHVLVESTAPPRPAMPEADASDMDEFFAQRQIVLPVLGVNAIRVRPTEALPAGMPKSAESPVFYLRNAKFGVNARAQQIDGEFTMLSGSVVIASWHGVGKAESTKKAYASYRAQHEQLLAEDAITVQPGGARLTRNVVFSSPSTAGAVALGRSCNGRVEWVATNGQQFGVWESRSVEYRHCHRCRAEPAVDLRRGNELGTGVVA